MAQIDLKDTQSGTAGINLFGFQVPTWLLILFTVALAGGIIQKMRNPSAPVAPVAAIAAPVAPVMQAAGRALKKLLRR